MPYQCSLSYQLALNLLGTVVEVTIDRPSGSTHPKHGFVYPVNYGYVAGITAPDGADLDAYYLHVSQPLQMATGRCIAIAHRCDDDDDKLIVVPDGVALSDAEIMNHVRFQEQWFRTVIIR